MYGSAIPRVTSKHPGPQPPPEISHCDCAGVNCTQKKAWRPLDGDLESSDFMRTELGQFVWICLRRKQDTHVIPEVYWSIVYFLLGNALDALAKFQTRGSRLFLCQMGRV